MIEFEIKVPDSSKCYFCGKKGKEVSDILNKMSKKIERGIENKKKQINNLDKVYGERANKIKKDWKGVDLSYKVNTIFTDRERFKDNVPHLDLLTEQIYIQVRSEVKKFTGRGSFPRAEDENPTFKSLLTIETLENDFKYWKSITHSEHLTLQMLADSLEEYFEIEKRNTRAELELELKKAELIKIKYEDHGIRPLVNMTSKPLGTNTLSMNRMLQDIPAQQNPMVVFGEQNSEHISNRYNMKQRTDEVQFVLSVCHFCYDRFQGSTL